VEGINQKLFRKALTPLSYLLLSALLFSCGYTSREELIQQRFDEGSYVVYWKSKETGFQSKMKGIFDHESAVELAEKKQLVRPENEYWVERFRSTLDK
jgi:hypothetical protein